MSFSTLMVLLLLTFGQILVLSIGFVVLWLAGEFEDSEKRAHGPEERVSARIGRRFDETRSAAVFHCREQVRKLLRSRWMRGYRPLIAGCLFLLVVIGISIGTGTLKPWRIAHFLPPSLTDGSKH
jgi:hypothetical protein